MSSIFSVARILGKGRAKRGQPTRSSTTASVTTIDKAEKNGTPKSSTVALPLPRQQTPPPPPAQPTTHAIFPAPASESPKAGPYKELEPTATRKASSTAETMTTVAEVEVQSKVDAGQELKDAVIPTAPIVHEISEPAKPIQPVVSSVEEPGYENVSQPEAPKSEVEWTEVEPSPSSVSEVEQNSVESSAVVPVDLSTISTIDVVAPASEVPVPIPTPEVPTPDAPAPQQDGAIQDTSDKEIFSSEVVSGLKQKIQDVEAALHAAQEELETKSHRIEDLLANIDTMRNDITILEKSKEDTFEELRQEKNGLVEEIHRLKGIIAVERLDNREKIDSLVMEKEATEAKLDIQLERINRLEERLTEGRQETEAVYARNRDLESQLRQYQQDEDDTDLVAEKDNHIQMLEKNNENLSSRLVQLQRSLNDTERQNRMYLDQLRRQSNELQARKNPLGRLGSTIWGMTGAPRVEGAISTMKSLNEDIFQTAAALTDQLEAIPKRFVVEDEGLSAKAELLKSMLGLELVKALQEEAQLPSEESNPLFVQIALQGCLTASCMRIITSWYPAEWEYGNLLVALYERIRGSGGPEIALIWKKATQQSCLPSTDRNAKLIGDLTEQIETVLLVSGWSTQGPVAELLKVKYSQNLAGIVFNALRLNGLTTATGGNQDAESFSIDAGKMFDPNQMTNDSPFDEIARESRVDSTPDEQVICTTALGLKSADNDTTKPDQILLKPKVFLHGGLL